MADIELDPNFMLPDGLVGVGFVVPRDEEDDPEVDTADDAPDTVDLDDDGLESDAVEDSEDIQESGELLTPGPITVVSQTVRTASDGSSVVDIILDVPEVPGATNYRVRVTR